MSGEFLTHYSVEQSETVHQHIEQAIKRAGSLEGYLLAVEVEQARTPSGRAELLRLQRVGQFITSPLIDEETAQSMAFYKGALFGASVAAALQEGEFNAGTLAHELLNDYLTEKRLVSEKYTTGPYGKENKKIFAEEIEVQTHEWPENKGDAIETLYQLAEHHLPTLYPYDDDLYDDALTGFWAPIRMVYEKQLNIEHINDEEADIRPLTTERSLLNTAFNSIRREFDPILATVSDQEVRASIYRIIERKLQQLNHKHSLLTPDQLLCVSGEGLYRSSFGTIDAENQPLTPEIEIIGHFDGIAVLDTPILKPDVTGALGWRIGGDTAEENNEENTIQVPTVGIIIKEPTFLNYSTEEDIESTEGVTVTIPLIYAGIGIDELKRRQEYS